MKENNNKRERCLWCGSSNTFMLGAEGWDIYRHCQKCGSDYIISMKPYAWTSEEVDGHNEQYLKQFRTQE